MNVKYNSLIRAALPMPYCNYSDSDFDAEVKKTLTINHQTILDFIQKLETHIKIREEPSVFNLGIQFFFSEELLKKRIDEVAQPLLKQMSVLKGHGMELTHNTYTTVLTLLSEAIKDNHLITKKYNDEAKKDLFKLQAGDGELQEIMQATKDKISVNKCILECYSNLQSGQTGYPELDICLDREALSKKTQETPQKSQSQLDILNQYPPYPLQMIVAGDHSQAPNSGDHSIRNFSADRMQGSIMHNEEITQLITPEYSLQVTRTWTTIVKGEGK